MYNNCDTSYSLANVMYLIPSDYARYGWSELLLTIIQCAIVHILFLTVFFNDYIKLIFFPVYVVFKIYFIQKYNIKRIYCSHRKCGMQFQAQNTSYIDRHQAIVDSLFYE